MTGPDDVDARVAAGMVVDLHRDLEALLAVEPAALAEELVPVARDGEAGDDQADALVHLLKQTSAPQVRADGVSSRQERTVCLSEKDMSVYCGTVGAWR